MKDYNEITKSLLERRDKYVADKKVKSKKAMTIIAPVVGVLVVTVGVVAAVKGSDIKNNVELIISDYASEAVESVALEDATTSDKDAAKDNVSETIKINSGNNDGVETEIQQGEANDYGSDNLKPSPADKNHNNNKDHDQNLTQGQTEPKDEKKWIDKIVVTQLPIKTTYYVGETLDFTGLEVTGYFINGDVEDITPYVQIYTTTAGVVSNRFRVYMEYTDNSEVINLAYTEFYVKVLPMPEQTTTEEIPSEAVIEQF